MDSIIIALAFVLQLVSFLVIAHVVMSWLINFQVLNVRQPLVSQIWYGLNRVLEPIYAPIRRLLPPMSGLDFAPLIVLVVIILMQRWLPSVGGIFGY